MLFFQFYKDVLDLGELAKLGRCKEGGVTCFTSCLSFYYVAYFNDLVVGGVCCRVEVEGDQKRLYIMTLGVLAPYRRLGIGVLGGYKLWHVTEDAVQTVVKVWVSILGSLLLKHVLKCAKEDGNINNIYL